MENLILVNRLDLQEVVKEIIANTKSELRKELEALTNERYLKTDEVCQMLGVTNVTLWRWEKAEYLKPIQVGGKKRFKLSSINQILEG